MKDNSDSVPDEMGATTYKNNEDTTIILDAQCIDGCTFVRCRLVRNGFAPAWFGVGNDLVDCELVLEGKAKQIRDVAIADGLYFPEDIHEQLRIINETLGFGFANDYVA